MMRWVPYTFVRVSLFFIAGILLGLYAPGVISLFTAVALFAVAVLTYVVLYFLFRKTGPVFNPGLLGLPAIFIGGYAHLTAQTSSNDPDNILHAKDSIQYYEVVVSRFFEEKARSWKAEATVRKIDTGHWARRSGKVVLYFSKEDYRHPYRYGDVLLIKGSPSPVLAPANPGEFDYRRFLSFRNIYHQHFLRAGDVRPAGYDPPYRLMAWAIQARLWADGTLKKFVLGEREQAIASALVLGVVDGLDNELLHSYAATGAMHVLAVSGLHISILYLILLWILKPLRKSKTGRWTLALVSVLVLWTYAFITGLSPSVLRAVMMFTFVAIARPASQSTNIYNTLAASAFCLLLIDPFLIMSVGFQLSYLAVLGIVYLQPGLYRLWEPGSRFWDEAWKITSVSIAAQVATFALGLLYFHQFPNYFLVSNLLVIPVSSIVLILGIAVLSVGFIGILAGFLGWMLTYSIKLLNLAVFTVESFPFSVVENIYITPFQCWLLMGAVMGLVLLVQYRKFYYAWASATLLLLFSFLQWHHFYNDVEVQKITVYHVRGHGALDLIDRGQSFFLADAALLADEEKVRFHIRPNRLLAGVSKTENGREQPFVREQNGVRIILWKNKVIAHIINRKFKWPEAFRPDYVIIGNNAVSDIGRISKPGIRKIILDSSNTYSFSRRTLKKAKDRSVIVQSVLEEGAIDIMLGDS